MSRVQNRVREKKMKNYVKYSVLVMLAIAMTISLVSAVLPIVPIGKGEQKVPFESSPTNTAYGGAGAPVDIAKMYDSDLESFGTCQMGSGLGSVGRFEFNTFKVPADPKPFALNWVDIKINYKIPAALVDDQYSIEYTLGTTAWTALVANITAANVYDVAITRAFSQVSRPGGGSWTWADIPNLRVRFVFNKITSWDVKILNIYEVWASLYPEPLPPSSSTAVSIQPADISGSKQYSFFDVYGMGLSWWDSDFSMYRGLWGYEIHIRYDTTVITALEYYSYWPWNNKAPSSIDDPNGLISVSYTSYGGDPIGFIGNSPLFRVYFKTDSLGPVHPHMFHIEFCELKPAALNAVYPTTYDGRFWAGAVMSAVTDLSSLTPKILPSGSPVGSFWHELYPTYSNKYTVTDWVDTDGGGSISYCDHIKLDGQWFHVIGVTVTIHFTFKAFDMPAKAEPKTTPTLPMGDPRLEANKRWHIVWSSPDLWAAGVVYCEWFNITSWTDTGLTGQFDPSDQFDFSFDNPALNALDSTAPYWAHLDAISTDIWVIEEPGPIPEFPLGIGLVMALAPAIPIIYLWRTRPKKKVTQQ